MTTRYGLATTTLLALASGWFLACWALGAAEVAGNRAGLRFDCTFGGLKSSDGGALQGFTVAGEDRRFAPAQAEIAGDMVWVSSAVVPKPVAVRYAWAYNPACNLVNGAGLPASPFRTDAWPFLLPLAQTEPDLR